MSKYFGNPIIFLKSNAARLEKQRSIFASSRIHGHTLPENERNKSQSYSLQVCIDSITIEKINIQPDIWLR